MNNHRCDHPPHASAHSHSGAGDSRNAGRSCAELGASGILKQNRTFAEISFAAQLLSAQVTIGKKP
jgi:hypothetical protein